MARRFATRMSIRVANRFANEVKLCPPLLGNVSETPTPTTCPKVWQYTPNLYGSTPPICIAALSWLLSFEERETPQYASHLYCSTPPICTAVRPPFVRQYFWKNTGGWGHRDIPPLCHPLKQSIIVAIQTEVARCCFCLVRIKVPLLI